MSDKENTVVNEVISINLIRTQANFRKNDFPILPLGDNVINSQQLLCFMCRMYYKTWKFCKLRNYMAKPMCQKKFWAKNIE